MTRNPITIAESLNVNESLEIMNEKIMHLIVQIQIMGLFTCMI